MRRNVAVLTVCVSTVAMFGSLAAQRSPVNQLEHLSTMDALQQYARGNREVIAERVTGGLPPLETMTDALLRISRWFRLPGPAGARTSRELSAFSVEIARYFGHQAGSTACLLIGSARARWLDDERTTVFARTWHAAAVATMLRLDCPGPLEKEIEAAIRAFPADPRFRLSLAVAAEQRLANRLANGGVPSVSDVREIDSRFTAAFASAGVLHEAALHWARVKALLGNHAEAIRLSDIAVQSSDRDVQYVAHVFRGTSLSQLGEGERADDSFRSALAILPNAQTATLARAAARFAQRDSDSAEKIMSRFLEAGARPEDPWWKYAIGDGRFIDRLVRELRAAIER